MRTHVFDHVGIHRSDIVQAVGCVLLFVGGVLCVARACVRARQQKNKNSNAPLTVTASSTVCRGWRTVGWRWWMVGRPAFVLSTFQQCVRSLAGSFVRSFVRFVRSFVRSYVRTCTYVRSFASVRSCVRAFVRVHAARRVVVAGVQSNSQSRERAETSPRKCGRWSWVVCSFVSSMAESTPTSPVSVPAVPTVASSAGTLVCLLIEVVAVFLEEVSLSTNKAREFARYIACEHSTF